MNLLRSVSKQPVQLEHHCEGQKERSGSLMECVVDGKGGRLQRPEVGEEEEESDEVMMPGLMARMKALWDGRIGIVFDRWAVAVVVQDDGLPEIVRVERAEVGLVVRLRLDQ